MAAVICAAAVAPAAALPRFTGGSFGYSALTDTTTDLDISFTNFHLVASSIDNSFNGGKPAFDLGTDSGSFATVSMPVVLKVAPPVSAGNLYILKFNMPADFSWDASSSGSDIGSFTATSTAFGAHLGTKPHASVEWDVTGFFTVGSEFRNAGEVIPATETWSLTQTGLGPHVKSASISMSGTFFSVAPIPEPASLALFGSALLAAGASFRRRKAPKNA
jgi:hypothetical protein